MSGLFITFEGIEGCGKTTQISLFADYLKARGFEVVLTREPGGTDIGDQIRQILLNPNNIRIFPKTELLLYCAARSQHVDEKIRPALANGKYVISDRYADASEAYQGAARKLPGKVLEDLFNTATDGLKPGITFLLDLPAEIGLKRARARNTEVGHEDRFENEKEEFHKKVRLGYLKIAEREPERVVIIDAAGPVESIHLRIREAFEKRFK